MNYVCIMVMWRASLRHIIRQHSVQINTNTHTHTDSLSCAGTQAGRSSSRVLSGESEHLIGSRWADGPSLCSAPPTQAPPHPLLSETIRTYPSPADKHTKTHRCECGYWGSNELSSYANNKSYVSAELYLNSGVLISYINQQYSCMLD